MLLVQTEQQHREKLAALHEEKDVQMQQCQDLRRDLQEQLQYIQQVVIQLNNKEACLEAKFVQLVQDLEAQHAATLPKSSWDRGNCSV